MVTPRERRENLATLGIIIIIIFYFLLLYWIHNLYFAQTLEKEDLPIEFIGIIIEGFILLVIIVIIVQPVFFVIHKLRPPIKEVSSKEDEDEISWSKISFIIFFSFIIFSFSLIIIYSYIDPNRKSEDFADSRFYFSLLLTGVALGVVADIAKRFSNRVAKIDDY